MSDEPLPNWIVKFMTWAMVIVLAFMGWCSYKLATYESPPPDTSIARKATAMTVCQEAVKRQLVSPGSADFPYFDQMLEEHPDHWEYTSYVDSQNRFGGVLRSNFYCMVRDSTWEIENLVVREQ